MKNTVLFPMSVRAVAALALLVTVATSVTRAAEYDTSKLIDWKTSDFSQIAGANYIPSYANNDVTQWDRFDAEVIDRELSYAASAGINSIRVFMQIIVYEKDPERYVENFETFLQLCDKHGITMMPILFDSCFGTEPNFESRGWVACPGNTRVSQESWPGCEKYIDAVVTPHIGDPRIALWDVMNEPMVAGKFTHSDEGKAKVWRFLRHFIQYVNDLDPTHATTTGVASPKCFPMVADLERVIGIHTYFGGEPGHRMVLGETIKEGKARNKPVLVSEMVHYGLGQTYEMALRVCRELNIGYFFWEVMIGIDPFPQVTGIFYPDGTIRSADHFCASLGIEVKDPIDGIFMKEAIGEDELRSRFKEALAAPTQEWNLRERMALLATATVNKVLMDGQLAIEQPGITNIDRQRKSREGDSSLIEREQEIKAEFSTKIHKAIAEMRKLYRDGGAESAFAKCDAIFKELAEPIAAGATE